MTREQKLKYLSLALKVSGTFLLFGVGLMMMWVWPAAWTWEPRQPEYEQMIMGIYATLGVFLLIASRNPQDHLSLIRFTIWSSIVHGGIMMAQATVDRTERANLLGDIPALLALALVLWILLPGPNDK